MIMTTPHTVVVTGLLTPKSGRRSSSSMSVPVTRFSFKLYGGLMGIEREQQRQKSAGSLVIHPYSNFRFYWDLVSLVLLIVCMLTIPVAITFFSSRMSSDTGWIVFNLTMDSWFLADIVINFHTGYILDNGEGDVVLDLNKIRVHYLKTWFLIDITSTLPLDYILQITSVDSESASASRAMKLFRLAKVISLLRLLRISRLIRYVHQWEQIVGLQYDLAMAAIRIFNLVCLMLLIGHWNGCLQFLVPMLQGFPNNSWVISDELLTLPWTDQYLWCLFKAMSHMLCIGYGKNPPSNITDLWMTMISMISGAVCFAMFIGHATALIQSMDSSKRQYKEKYTQVKEYMRYRRLPPSLREKVYKYYEHRFQGKMFDEEGILGELSTNLREEIVNFNCRHLVSSVPFFQNADPDFVTAVVQKLKFEVFQPNDVIVKENTVGRKMFFIQQGLVEIRKREQNVPVVRLADGSFFGEICLIISDRRVASVVAVCYCHTYSLHADDLNEILDDYPMMRETLEKVAAERLKNIGRKNEKSSDGVKETASTDEAEKLAAKIASHDVEIKRECSNQINNLRPLVPQFKSKKSLHANRPPENLLPNLSKPNDNYLKVSIEEPLDHEEDVIIEAPLSVNCKEEPKTPKTVPLSKLSHLRKVKRVVARCRHKNYSKERIKHTAEAQQFSTFLTKNDNNMLSENEFIRIHNSPGLYETNLSDYPNIIDPELQNSKEKLKQNENNFAECERNRNPHRNDNLVVEVFQENEVAPNSMCNGRQSSS